MVVKVKLIPYAETKPWILEHHYAKRMPSVSWAFGLFVNDKLEGVVTYGKPVSPYLCTGICGAEHKAKVYELSRLCINSTAPKNSASMLVGRSLKLLPKDLIIVSYADTGQGHVGYVYQATNWIFTGTTKKRTDIDPGKGKHPRHYKQADRKNRKIRWPKHRYVYFRDKKRMLKNLNYPILPYPKGDSKRYKCDDT